MDNTATGTHIPELTFTVEKAGGAPFTYQTIKLKNVTVLDYEEKAGFATRVAFGYDEIEVTSTNRSRTGRRRAPMCSHGTLPKIMHQSSRHRRRKRPPSVTDGAFTASGQVCLHRSGWRPADGFRGTVRTLPVDTTLPADALALLRPLLEAAFQIDPATGAWQFNLPQDAAKLLAANEIMRDRLSGDRLRARPALPHWP